MRATPEYDNLTQNIRSIFCSKITKLFRIYTRFFVYQAKRNSIWALEFVICFISQFKNQNKLFENFIFLSFLSFLPKRQVYWTLNTLTTSLSHKQSPPGLMERTPTFHVVVRGSISLRGDVSFALCIALPRFKKLLQQQ